MSSTAASSGASTPTASNAGITTTATGERIIPASVRPDGSVRREIRVRPGYRPPEDVELYKNARAKEWRARVEKGGVPGAEGLKAEKEEEKSEAAKKNAKRREARKRAAENKKADDGEKPNEKDTAATKDEPSASTPTQPQDTSSAKKKPEEMTSAEKEKAAKALRKKLKQAQELKKKSEEGGEKLLPEQFEKVRRIVELTRQLEALGLKE